MLYAIMAEDIDDSLERRKAARPEHLARLESLKDLGRLVIAGPYPAIDNEDPGPAGFTGSLIIAEFASYEEAKLWADSDPYVSAGVYRSIIVKPFRKTLP